MPIEFRCTQCGKLLRTPDGTGGQQAKCPACGAVVTVPEPGPMPAPADVGADPWGDASGYGVGDSMNPYQAPGDIPTGTTPFAPAVSRGAIRPTRIEFGEVLSQTWSIFKDKWLICLGVAVVCAVINFVAGQVSSAMLQILATAGPVGLAGGVLIYIAAQVFAIWLYAGQAIFFVKTARGEAAEFTDVFGGGPYLLRLIGAGILFSLAMLAVMGVCLLPAGALAVAQAEEPAQAALFIGFLIGMVGVTIVGLALFPYRYLIIDQNMGIIESLSHAWRITSGNRLTVLGIGIVTGIAAMVVTLCTCLVGLLGVIPYMALLYAVIYVMMIGHATAAQRANTAPAMTPAGAP